jgi:3-oxoacyl-[acyl-carrier-protein] synthase II
MARDTDKQGRPIVVITGLGVQTSLGQGLADNWAALTAGKTGIKRLTRFPIECLKTTFAGTIDDIALPEWTASGLTELLAELAIEEALADSGLGRPGAFPGPLFLAMPPVEIEWPMRTALMRESGDTTYAGLLREASKGNHRAWHERNLFSAIPEHLADRFGTTGSPIAINTACASGASALQVALEALRRGEAEAAICAGTDASVTQEALIRFSLLSALSTRNDTPQTASRPFSGDRDGFVMAEGAGALIVETLAHARARGATILGVLEGAGEKADSFHRTRSSPDGKPIIETLTRALADAGVTAGEIGYINAHGTSTPENEKIEWHCVATVFGERASRLPISSNKSMIGHTLSAAGAVEAVFTVKTLREGLIPPTINYVTPDPTIPIDCVPNTARRADVFRAMSNSFGFGGQNVSLVIAREPV